MTIFAVAALSAVAWVRETLAAVERAGVVTQTVRSASDYLDRVALWPREDFDRHLGAHRQGAWTVLVERPSPSLYLISISDTLGARPLVYTAVYRRAP